MPATNPHHGMKVTNDPSGRQNPIREGAGPVTSDSLAAESVRAGGAFAENRDSAPLAVKGANSTFNTTDTSAAEVLPPARDAARRPGPEEELSGLGKGYIAGAPKGSEADSAVKEESQQHEQQTQSEGASSGQDTKGSSGSDHTSSSHGTSGVGKESGHEAGTQSAEHHHGHHGGKKHHESETTHQPEPAPTYVKADLLDQPLHAKPKGRNVTEGGIEDDAPNASSTAEIGSEDDPGRLAEAKFETVTAKSVRDTGNGPKETAIKDDDQFKVLGEEEAP